MKKALLLAAALAFCITSTVMAHDGSDVAEFFNVGSAYEQVSWHDDEDPWKGLFTLTVTNSSTQAWGDFHFGVWGAPGVIFDTDGGNYPTMDGSPMAGTANNYFEIVGAGQQLNLFFYDDPVMPGDVVEFVVYTDNTLNKNDLFGIYYYPTPVPEPTTIALLGLGVVGLIRKRK